MPIVDDEVQVPRFDPYTGEPVDGSDEATEAPKPKKAKKVTRDTRTDNVRGEEASADMFSHYLALADGRRVRFSVGNSPHEPMPATFGGVPVTGVSEAIASGTVAEDDDE